MAHSGIRAALGVTLLLIFVARATAAPEGRDAAFMRAAAMAVETIEREDGFSGVILVARGNQVLLRKAAGFADRERNIPNTPETKFPLASLGKQFTAAYIMLLMEDGKVSIDDRISKYYPASPSAWRDVTVKHLLTHGSGIRDYWVTHPEARQQALASIRSYEDIFQLVVSDPLGFEPGTRLSYSNAGYALLTAIIEHASGQSYGEFVRSRLFGPLGMRDTGYGTIPGDAPRGYVRSSQGEWSVGRLLEPLTRYGGVGRVYSTLDDMLIWSHALFGGKVLSGASEAAMFSDYGFNYGFGWRFAPKFGKKLIWHTGNGGDYGSIFDRFPEEDLTVVAMTNNMGPTGSTATLLIDGQITTFPANAARKLVEEVERLYFGRAP
jgi:CubicO group peptidase (beta-lactamase class C family)